MPNDWVVNLLSSYPRYHLDWMLRRRRVFHFHITFWVSHFGIILYTIIWYMPIAVCQLKWKLMLRVWSCYFEHSECPMVQKGHKITAAIPPCRSEVRAWAGRLPALPATRRVPRVLRFQKYSARPLPALHRWLPGSRAARRRSLRTLGLPWAYLGRPPQRAAAAGQRYFQRRTIPPC